MVLNRYVTVVLGLVAAAFLIVLRYPFVGISVFLTTFLINYPAAARGTGPITINNLLTGQVLRRGRINADVLRASLGLG